MSRPEADFVVRNVGLMATLAGPAPRLGAALREPALVEDAALAASAGRIVYAGPERDLAAATSVLPQAEVIDAQGGAVTPGFVDAHTHLAFAGNRDGEVQRRLGGATYREIAAAGGGIVRTVEATRGASVAELARLVRGRLDDMLCQGTTTCEVKSGYGLDTDAELRSLAAIQQAAREHPMTVVPTFLGAHEVPPERRSDRAGYVASVIDEMIPEVARRSLAEFADCFCEEGVFSVAESREILSAARRHGLKLRLHADELGTTGGAELAAELGACSADHLVFVSEAGMRALARASCVAVLLPAASFYLRLGRFAPARAMIEAGVPVALATDVNPGGGLSPSMPFVLALACFGMGLTLEEALAAATVNAACSLDRQHEVGSLEVGKRADLLVLRSRSLVDLLRVGSRAIRAVVKNGRVVVADGQPVGKGD